LLLTNNTNTDKKTYKQTNQQEQPTILEKAIQIKLQKTQQKTNRI